MKSYEQKYKEALEQAKQELRTCCSLDCDAARQVFRLFPELKKSEDELVKAELIHFLEICQDTHLVANRKRDKWIEWLNKLIVKHEDKPNKCTCDNEVLVGYDCTLVDLSKFCDEIQEFSDMLEDKPKPYWDGWYEAMEWIRTHGNPFEKQGEQKPVKWSEEDEKMFNSAIWHINNSVHNGLSGNGSTVCNWLKSLKERLKGE